MYVPKPGGAMQAPPAPDNMYPDRSVTYSCVALSPVTGISPSFLMLSGFLGSSSKAPNRSSSSISIEKL